MSVPFNLLTGFVVQVHAIFFPKPDRSYQQNTNSELLPKKKLSGVLPRMKDGEPLHILGSQSEYVKSAGTACKY